MKRHVANVSKVCQSDEYLKQQYERKSQTPQASTIVPSSEYDIIFLESSELTNIGRFGDVDNSSFSEPNIEQLDKGWYIDFSRKYLFYESYFI